MAADDVLQQQIRHEAAGLSAIRWQVDDGTDDGFTIARSADGWAINAANHRSALWAVRHLRSGGSAGTYKPRFAIRGVNLCESLARHTPEQVDKLVERMADWRMNRLVIHPQYGWREHGRRVERACAARGIEVVHYVYTNLAFTPDAAGPLLAKDETGKPYRSKVECYTRLCSSSPAARQAFRDGARRYFRGDQVADGQRMIFQVADGSEICRCPQCRSISAIDQWQPLFDIAVEEAHAAGRGLKVEFISYVLRFGLPSDMAIFRQVDGVMFDLHWRYRYAALDQPHRLTEATRWQAEADPRAKDAPINPYLLDRLREWRRAYRGGPLYVFENLMMQATLSCPQPTSRPLLDDLDLLERAGIDGVVYEAFEPGMASFQRQLSLLSRAMWSDAAPPDASLNWVPDESLLPADRLWPAVPELADRLLAISAGPSETDPALAEYLRWLASYFESPTWPGYAAVAQYLLDHPDRFDTLYIATLLAKRLNARQPLGSDDPLVHELLHTEKLWDFQEAHRDDPRGTTTRALQRIVAAACQRHA